MKLTEEAHLYIREKLHKGDNAIDATMGHGHDTAFLASCVGPSGHVYAFDIQEDAMKSTHTRLEEEELIKQATLHLQGHEKMLEILPNTWVQNTQAILFNLGYLPHSDKTCITQKETTLKALEASNQLLATKGILSIMLYPEHVGGKEEALAVWDWIHAQKDFLTIIKHLKSNGLRPGPEWICLQKG